MATDPVLTAVQYLWQVHYIKLILQSRPRMQCNFWGALIAAALQSVYAFRVSGGDIIFLWCSLTGAWRISGVVASSYYEFVIGPFCCNSLFYNHRMEDLMATILPFKIKYYTIIMKINRKGGGMMEQETVNKANANSVEIKVVSDGFAVQSINLMYSGCSHTQNNKPTTQ